LAPPLTGPRRGNQADPVIAQPDRRATTRFRALCESSVVLGERHNPARHCFEREYRELPAHCSYRRHPASGRVPGYLTPGEFIL